MNQAVIPTVQEAEQLLYREARLLDERRYEEWLELFTDDGLYWLPIESNGASGDPTGAVSIIYDDTTRREERVYRTLHTPVLDQNPASRTVHLVSNVEVATDVRDDGNVAVYSTQLITEMRPGGQAQVGLGEVRSFAGRCQYHLRRRGDEWLIALKKLVLINCDRPLYNLTFIL